MNSGFKGYHPLVNVIFFVSVIAFGMFFKHPVCLAVSFVASTVYYLKISGSIGRRTLFKFLLPMLLVVVIINSFFNHYGVTTLFMLPSGNAFTFEALCSALASGLMVVTVTEWFFCSNEIVTDDKFMHIFGRILPKGALVLSMALRFVPLYRRRYREISQAGKGIGLGTESRSPVAKIKIVCRDIGVLISRSLENAIETADSMKARGYETGKRTYYSRFRITAGDIVALIIILTADIFVTVGALGGQAYSIYNPYVVINQPTQGGAYYFINELNLTVNPLTAGGAAMLAAYTLLCFLPLIIDLREDVKWNRLKLKI